MQIFKMIKYGIYMIFVRLKGIKFNYIYKTKGQKEAFKYGQDVFGKWSEVTIKTVGMDIEIKGYENIPNETCTFIGNHMSILDIPVLRYASKRGIGFIAKKEVLKVPVLGFWVKHMNCVALDRDNVREAIKVIAKGVEFLKSGYDMAIFPEGTRAKDGKVHEFKKGSIKLATKAKVPIVPFSIDGTSKCFEDNRKFSKGKVTIVFGKPIYTDNLTKEEEKTLTERVQKEVINNMIWVK
ncbi:lysophospholipid acyltransferase family protein [Eubacterium multiforme]|uniref:1-acyl-sn-glycerol-3-phosphate acyltransferase n=1 Tax=Eubacterium multiforme TaxID=83339 RepID=A0ABT9UP26_9FIRM|nr:lysophospholipid acyltransferase family protein [Eubacterium multiforme]MDQ0148389.1 1-acyl-sn-glycerol-3-phosphate acyltransferase [Eubacterium multiforme]